MIDFSTLSRQEAEAYCDRFVAAIPDQVTWLGREVARTGGPVAALDAGADGLESLYLWLMERIRLHDGQVQGRDGRPGWYDPDRPNPYLSDGSLWLIDAVGCHLAVLVQQALPDAHWAVYRVPEGYRDIKENRCLLHGVHSSQPADPVSATYSAVVGVVVHGKALAPDRLRRYFDAVTRP